MYCPYYSVSSELTGYDRWATQRKVFGKPLINQPVIRSKLAQMISRCETLQAWLENVTYQMCNMAYKEQASKLAGYDLILIQSDHISSVLTSSIAR